MVVIKSTHICHLFGVFLTNSILAIHIGYFVSLMNLTLDILPISLSMVTLFTSPTFRFLYATIIVEGLAMRRWHTTLVSISDMLKGARSNKLTFLMCWLISSCSYSSVSEVPIFVNLWAEGSITTSFKSSVGVSISSSPPNLGSQQSMFVSRILTSTRFYLHGVRMLW